MRFLGGLRATAGLGAITILLILAPALSGCDQFQKGFDQGFNKSWSKKQHDSCVSSSSGAPADVIERYCACLVTQLMPLKTSQKMGLTQSSPEVQSAMATCKAQVQEQSAGESTPATTTGSSSTP